MFDRIKNIFSGIGLAVKYGDMVRSITSAYANYPGLEDADLLRLWIRPLLTDASTLSTLTQTSVDDFNVKPVFRQLQACPYVEISATSPQMEWIRLSGKAVFDGSMAAKKKAFEVMPSLKDMYPAGADDPAFEVFYLDEAKVAFFSFATYGTEPEMHCF